MKVERPPGLLIDILLHDGEAENTALVETRYDCTNICD